MMDKKNLIFWVVSLTILIIGLYRFGGDIGPQRRPVADRVNFLEMPVGGDFEVKGVSGPIRLADFQGKVVLLYFGYTFCPDVCPTSLQVMAAAVNRFSKEKQEEMVGLFISVDPKRDTVEKLAEYSRFFHPKFLGATGSSEQLLELQRKYDMNYQYQQNPKNPGDYTVDHTSYIFVINREGNLVHRVKHGISVNKLVQIIGKTL